MTDTLFRPEDPPQCTRAIKRLIKEGFKVRRPTRYQIAVGPYNFYWTKGTITIGDERQRATGFEEFLRILPRRLESVAFEFDEDADTEHR